MKERKMIVAEGIAYDLDPFKTQLNNNVLVVGDNHIIGLSHLTFRKTKAA